MTESQQPVQKVVIYQMLTRLFGNQQSTNRPYGTRDENGVGKFNDITDDALREIKALGVSHVWYTGVIEHAVLTDYTAFGIALDDADIVKGRAGSPYAIKDYYDVNPDLAVDVDNRMREFEALVQRTHAGGMKVIIDFVPNHVARAYQSDKKPEGVRDLGADDDRTKPFSPANNFYYLPGESFQVPSGYQPLGDFAHPTKDGRFDERPAKVTGNDQFTASPGLNDWFETVKLNYGVDIQQGRQTHFDPTPDTWNKMHDILAYWAAKGVDGFRCDMAEMVPVAFWQWVIPRLKQQYPDLVFIAEVYNPDEYRNYIDQGRFDFLYDKSLLYDTLRMLVNGDAKTTDIAAIQQRLSGINDHMLHFMENHDEQRLASRFFAGDMWKGVPAMVVSATIDKGPVMIYFGQEVGEPANGATGFSGDDGRTSIYDYVGVPEHQKWMNGGKFDGALLSMEQRQLRMFYADLLTLSGKNPAFAAGDYIDITAHNRQKGNLSDRIHVFLRVAGDERMLVVNGFNAVDEEVRVELPPDVLGRIGLDPDRAYIARDLLWREVEVGFDDQWGFSLVVKPYSSFILKIK